MHIQLLNDTKKIIQEVKDISGKDIIFRENDNLKTYAIAKIARSTMPQHIIYYKPVHNDIINHIIAHECGHMIRTYRENARRLIPYSDDETMKKAFDDIDKNIKSGLSEDMKSEIYQMWINGIISQITNIPEDVRIEKWLYENYQEIRISQKASLTKQVNDIIASSSQKIKEITPEILFTGSGVINYYFVRNINAFFKTTALTVLSKTDFFQIASKLFHEVNEIQDEEDSLSNSIKITDYLAEKLGFVRWFKWKDFEDIPVGYEELI